MMEEAKGRFPQGLDYDVALDTTLAVSEGIHEIYKTLGEAIVLVIIVVFIFLQGWRATLIPLLAVPGLADWNVCGLPHAGLLHQHAVAVRTWCWRSDWWWMTPSSWSKRWSITSSTA